MKRLAVLMMAGLAACAATPPPPRTFPAAQAIVEGIAARHGDLVRLTIHAVPTGGTRSRVIASSSAAKLDHWSDPEDLRALETGEPSDMMEGANLDYTEAVVDNSGNVIAAIGVTVSGEGKPAMLESAKRIATETSAAIAQAPGKLW